MFRCRMSLCFSSANVRKLRRKMCRKIELERYALVSSSHKAQIDASDNVFD